MDEEARIGRDDPRVGCLHFRFGDVPNLMMKKLQL